MMAVLQQLPPQVRKAFPGFNGLARAWLLKQRDEPFVVDNPYRMTFGNTAGEAWMQLVAPSGKMVAEKRVVSSSLRADDRLRLEVPADGETGRYELRLLLKAPTAADLGNSFVRVRTSLEKAMYDASDQVLALYGPGRLWFYVPPETKRFSVVIPQFTGGGVALRDPDGVRVAGFSTSTARPGSWAKTDPVAVDVEPAKAGRWWHLSVGVRSWPPLPVRLVGIPPYVAVRQSERFVMTPTTKDSRDSRR
jgi:hypothetical protein